MFDENMDGAFGSFREKADTKSMGLNPVILNYWGVGGSGRRLSDLDRVRKQQFRHLLAWYESIQSGRHAN